MRSTSCGRRTRHSWSVQQQTVGLPLQPPCAELVVTAAPLCKPGATLPGRSLLTTSLASPSLCLQYGERHVGWIAEFLAGSWRFTACQHSVTSGHCRFRPCWRCCRSLCRLLSLLLSRLLQTAAAVTVACVPLAADLVITHALEWPSLTVQWLPVSSICCGPAPASPPPLLCIAVRNAASPASSCVFHRLLAG